MNDMRILVCGGRNFTDYRFVLKTLDAIALLYSEHANPDDNWLPTDIVIISGCAKGPDTFALDWAATNWCATDEFPIEWWEWKKYGFRAGPRRNGIMLREGKPDLVVAFPGGRGTAHMVKISKEAGVPVREITYDDETTV